MENLNNKVAIAGKWSVLGEIVAKMFSPLISMVLARVLAPDAFGVVVTMNMIISFAEIFTDAGFQRYIIQHDFVDDYDKDRAINVAFWSNLVLSIIIWGIVIFFADSLAVLLGNPGMGLVISISCVSIPIAAFSSIQMALYKRSLDFKTLFYRRIVALIVPLVITIPLAILLKSYWALVIGTISVNCANAIVLTYRSSWKPKFYFSFDRLRTMLSFSIWSVIDSILVWATSYLEIFFIGTILSSYYIGLYKTAMTTVSQLTSVITAAVLPIVMPALSRVQNNHEHMRRLIIAMQKYVAILLLPIGFGLFTFRQLVTDIMLGPQWSRIADFIGIWGLMEVLTVIFSRFCSNIFPAIGKPRISVVIQILHLIVLIPAVIIAINYSFETLYWTRSVVRLQGVVLNVIFAYYTIKLSPALMIKNLIPEFISSLLMALLGILLLCFNSTIFCSLIWVIVCGLFYLYILSRFKSERKYLSKIIGQLICNLKKICCRSSI